MRANAVIFWLLSIFFAVASVVYAYWSWLDAGFDVNPEWVGTIALALTSVLSIFLGFYVQRSYQSQGGELPEDRLDGDVDDRLAPPLQCLALLPSDARLTRALEAEGGIEIAAHQRVLDHGSLREKV